MENTYENAINTIGWYQNRIRNHHVEGWTSAKQKKKKEKTIAIIFGIFLQLSEKRNHSASWDIYSDFFSSINMMLSIGNYCEQTNNETESGANVSHRFAKMLAKWGSLQYGDTHKRYTQCPPMSIVCYAWNSRFVADFT